MVLSVPNMIIRDINDTESPARQPITRERQREKYLTGIYEEIRQNREDHH